MSSFLGLPRKAKKLDLADDNSLVKCMLWNTRSAVSKMSLIVQCFADSGADFLVISETWQACPVLGKLDTFSASLKDFAIAESLHEVTVFTKARSTGKRGGGLALVTKKNIAFSYYSINLLSPESFEYLTLKCKCDSPFVLVGIYRLPGIAFNLFLQEFEGLLSALNFLPLPSVICGDFNVKINRVEDSESVSFGNLLYEHNFSVHMPNAATHNRGNVLDFLVCSAMFDPRCSGGLVDSSNTISDHNPVIYNFAALCASRRPLDHSMTFRAYRSIDEESFAADLASRLESIDPILDTSFLELLRGYNSALREVLDSHAPLHTRLRPRHVRSSWVDSEYIRARALRKRLQKRPDKTEYNIQNRLCARMAQEKREAYSSSVVKTLEKKQGKLYSVMNKLMGKDLKKCNFPTHDDPLVLANMFNNFFVEKVVNIRESLTSDVASAIPTVSEVGAELLSFHATDGHELLNIIAEHGVITNSDDPFPDFLIMKFLDLLLPYLVSLVNLSLSSASCDGIKEAHVVPILKSLSADHDEFKNYRPVSLLSFVSKLTERVVHARITDHLTENNLHNNSQFGYKKNHSCENLLLKLLDDILVGIDNKSGVVILFVDLSAAFDTVDHNLLLQILQNKFRIKGSAIEWIKSFLTGRSQKVKIGGAFSVAMLVAFGVPQGSILGPLLFNLYCSSIEEAFASAGFCNMGYADDNFGVRMFPAFSTPSTLFNKVPDCLKAVKLWANNHFLKLNSDKTRVMVFGNTQFFAQCPFNTFRNDVGELMPISHTVKVLGVTLDKTLGFDKHISNLVSSVNYALSNLRVIRKCLTTKSLETLVHSLITNKLDQCNSLLMGITQANLDKLQKLQNNALRLVLGLPARSHNISERMKEMHWLPVKSRIIFKYLVTVFKCINTLAPVTLAGKISLECPINMILRTDQFRPKSAFGRRAFSYLAPRYWNGLPRKFRTITSLDLFKSSLKTYLFDSTTELLHRVNPYTSFAISQPGSYRVFTNERRVFDDPVMTL